MYILFSDRQAWKLTSAGKFKNKAIDQYQLFDADQVWKFTKFNPPENRNFRIQDKDQLYYIETPDNKVLQRRGKNFRQVFRTDKKENEPKQLAKQLWKKRKIDGKHFWIVNSNFEQNPKNNKDLVLTAMGANNLKLKGISQSHKVILDTKKELQATFGLPF